MDAQIYSSKRYLLPWWWFLSALQILDLVRIRMKYTRNKRQIWIHVPNKSSLLTLISTGRDENSLPKNVMFCWLSNPPLQNQSVNYSIPYYNIPASRRLLNAVSKAAVSGGCIALFKISNGSSITFNTLDHSLNHFQLTFICSTRLSSGHLSISDGEYSDMLLL